MRRERSWQLDGACGGRVDHADWWFPHGKDQAKRARAVCARCPVRDPCLDFAIRENITDGVWGGIMPSERRKLQQTGS